MNLVNMNHSLTIEEFYKNKNVFVTGATGFLGKVLIDKLLRACPDIGNIYILLRPKKGKAIEERLEHLLNDMLFDTIKQTNPLQISKIKPLPGDCSQLKLGLSTENYNLIRKTVGVVYHVAASVRFDDALSYAVLLNTRGTREMCALALETENLCAFVHVSTTYSNCVTGGIIDEKIYEAPDDWKKAIAVAEKFDKNLLPVFGDKYLGPHPNTYTFSKALAESVVKDMCTGKIPTVICRPSIVVSTLNDPVKGWIDNFNGPMGLLIACGKGLVRSSYQDVDIYPDYIPVDCVVKSIIVASWDTALKKDLSAVEVLNCCSSKGWISLGDLTQVCRKYAAKYPFNGSIWVPKGSATTCKVYAYICIVFFHLIPAFFFDLGLKLSGRKPIVAKLQTKIYGATLQLRYFTTQEWLFKNNKFEELEKKILEKDKNIWSFDYNKESVEEYLINAILGCRKYFFRESDESLPAAKKHYWRMYWLDKATMTLLYGSCLWLLYYFETHEKIWNKLNDTFSYYTDGYYV